MTIRLVTIEPEECDSVLEARLMRRLAADDARLVAAAATLTAAEQRVANLTERRQKVRAALMALGYDVDAETLTQRAEQ